MHAQHLKLSASGQVDLKSTIGSTVQANVITEQKKILLAISVGFTLQ